MTRRLVNVIDQNAMFDPRYTGEPSEDVRDALKLVLLFYTIDWTPEKKAEWLRITGTTEATTKVMCDHIRSWLAVNEADEGTRSGPHPLR